MKNYIDENWPTSNSNPNVYYRLNWQDSRSSSTQHFYTVDDLETGVQQLKRHGKEITKAMRVEIVNGKTTETPFIPETRQEKTDRENRDHCRRIAEEADAYASGDVRRCPECGEEIWRDWGDVGDRFKCPSCHAVTDADEWEELTLWDFLADVLDVEFRVGSDREIRSVQLMVTCGGPNIYLDTATRSVELYWWGDRASYPLSYDTCDALDEWAEEYWNC